MHIRLTGIDGGDTRLTPDFLAGACIARHEAATRSGVSTPAHTVIHDGGRYYIVRETPDEILAMLAAVPTAPASIDEARLAAGWVQQVCRLGIDTRQGTQPRPGDCPVDRMRPADGGAGAWRYTGLSHEPDLSGDMPRTYVYGVWVRWLVPVETPP